MKRCDCCGADVRPFTEFTPTGIIERCPVDGCRGIFSNSGSESVVEDRVPQRTGRKSAPQKRTRAAGSSFDVVKEAKARLREVERELRDMAKLEKERDQLRRLIQAAERPLAAVKSLRGARSAD